MAEESTENSTSSEQQQSNENITIPPISKPAAGAAAGAVLGSVGGPVGAVVGGMIGAIAGKAAATGQPIGATAKKAIGLRNARRSRSKAKSNRNALPVGARKHPHLARRPGLRGVLQ